TSSYKVCEGKSESGQVGGNGGAEGEALAVLLGHSVLSTRYRVLSRPLYPLGGNGEAGDGSLTGTPGRAWLATVLPASLPRDSDAIRTRYSGISMPPTSFSTCIMGGSVCARLWRKCDVLPPLLGAPLPFSHTTTLSNLMLEIACAEVWARLSRCSSISNWNACVAPPQASMICRKPAAFLAK